MVIVKLAYFMKEPACLMVKIWSGGSFLDKTLTNHYQANLGV